MSKQLEKKNAELAAAKKVRLRSLVELEKDFTQSSHDDKKYFDKRIYIDTSGNIFYPYMFSKTLEHDPVTGFPLAADVDKILEATNEGTIASLDAIPRATGATRKLEGVLASSSFNLMGTDSSVYSPPAFYHVDTEEGSFEMAEVYGKALLRDVSFAEYDHMAPLSLANKVRNSLNSYSTKTTAPVVGQNITGKTLFRGPGVDETVGPYISQFLLLPFDYGNLSIEQKFASEQDYTASVTPSEWLDIQNGKVNGSISKTTPEHVWNGRVLGAKVHNDPLYQFYYNAALIAFQNGIGPSGFSHPKTTDWTSAGGPNVLAAVAHVALGALRCAWFSKYNVGMKIRPEVYAQRLVLANDPGFDSSKVPGLDEMNNLMKADMKSLVISANQLCAGLSNLYLMLQFPEGSPTHPSWCAGHAAVSGACVTVLKAMLDCHESNMSSRKPWPVQAQHALNGTSLVNYTETDANQMTIIGELNKLASNVALGRDFAGVHYRCDGDCGVALGEQYAITYLVDLAKELHESQNGLFEGWLLEKFDGSRIKITSEGTENL